MKKIFPCVVGLGYVGLPVFISLKKKFQVIGFDIDKKKLNKSKRKKAIFGQSALKILVTHYLKVLMQH